MRVARTIRSFTELLGLLNRGKFSARLDEELSEAISTLENLPAQKGKAVLTCQIEIVYEKGRMDVRPKVTSKLPDEGFGGNTFWPIEGELSVNHPSQMDIFDGPREAAGADRERDNARA